MKESSIEKNALAANERLTAAQRQLDAEIRTYDGSGPDLEAMNEISERLREARLCIDQIQQHIEASAEVVPPRRDCPACGKSIRVQATLCGYCWTRVSPSL
ncbi:hypothetical protein WMF04_29465 [Sorangium sp. So ce260]|uniref:hypothetical protein n=1 Tax=Sorangium sp. So ce260 TaxID=3133291 RepID=UPI003F5DBA62